MRHTDFKLLSHLAQRDRWDIEELWSYSKHGLDLPTLRRFDAEGWIELRTVAIKFSSNATPRTDPKPWYSPLTAGEPLNKYFPSNIHDLKSNQSWRPLLDALFVPQGKSLPQSRIFDLFKMAPFELRVTETARRAIVKDESSDGENNNGGDNEIEADGNAPVSQPTMGKLTSLKECIISDDTFRRIRVAAKVRKKLNGVKPRERRYSQSEVGHLIGALRSGKFNNAKTLIEGWSKWATPQISK